MLNSNICLSGTKVVQKLNQSLCKRETVQSQKRCLEWKKDRSEQVS